MLNLLYYLFIYPIEWVMQIILANTFALTNNYGFSIIILSIVVNILILPLYYLAQYLKDNQQRQLSNLELEANHIKSNYNKQERYYYLQTLHRIYNYNPLSVLKASLGLLLQIPFFFAAFHFLGNYGEFTGVSFGIIKDLSQSDKLLFGQNLLPILMTIISLFSAYFYAKNLTKTDKYQLFGLSAIFLILLYFESSALLLYWTINNIFFLIRNIIEDRFDLSWFQQKIVDIFKKIGLLLKTDSSKIVALSILSFSVPIMHFYASNKHLFAFDYRFFVAFLPATIMIAWGLLVRKYAPKYWRKLFAISIGFMIAITLFIPLFIGYIDRLYVKQIFIGYVISFMVFAWFVAKLRYYALLLLVLTLGSISVFVAKPQYKKPDINNTNLAQGFAELATGDKFIFKPNIYYLVPDSYPSHYNLLNLYIGDDKVDNTSFYNQLENKGFKTYKNAYSNYEHTFNSMSAVWLMRHHYIKNDVEELIKAYNGKNPVFSTLIDNNYQVYTNYNCPKFNDNIKCLPLWKPKFSLYTSIINYYLASGIAIMVHNIFSEKKMMKYNLIQDFTKNIASITNNSNNKPKLVYVHNHGLQLDMLGIGFKKLTNIVNNDLLSAIDIITKKDKDAIIIIQSDHGSRENWTNKTKQKTQSAQQVFGILSVIKWPSYCKRFNDVTILSQVNLFRYVFACASNKKPFELEADDSYQKGLKLKELWSNEIKKKVYKRIENGKILQQPIEISQ